MPINSISDIQVAVRGMTKLKLKKKGSGPKNDCRNRNIEHLSGVPHPARVGHFRERTTYIEDRHPNVDGYPNRTYIELLGKLRVIRRQLEQLALFHQIVPFRAPAGVMDLKLGSHKKVTVKRNHRQLNKTNILS
ncbi:MAG: hypothetical protein GY820_45955 [Gammaproteobacteria bacterium]|nr:hypothetical protein [Gammaproteobacteria bacterium]